MLLTLVIILILIGAAVIGSIYSNFLVFHSNFSESENYHKAYYASISALERGELVTKQRSPGYVGSGGFIMGKGTGSNNLNGGSDKNLSGFSYLGYNDDVSSVFWTINSRTKRIPSISGGDVERMLSTGDAVNYNMMGYENSEVFLLYYDSSTGNPYVSGDITDSKPASITGIIRLPKQLHESRSPNNLDTGNSLIAANYLPNDDAIVDRQIRGDIEISLGTRKPFTIYSTQSENSYQKHIDYNHESIFRESDINRPLNFMFGKNNSNYRDTINDTNNHGDRSDITVISEGANMISSDYNDEFKDVFKNKQVSLRFSLLNLLKTSTTGHIYPFLEYYADFGTGVSDKYYTIDAEGNFKDYQVNTIIQKPTVKESVLSNFTSIF